MCESGQKSGQRSSAVKEPSWLTRNNNVRAHVENTSFDSHRLIFDGCDERSAQLTRRVHLSETNTGGFAESPAIATPEWYRLTDGLHHDLCTDATCCQRVSRPNVQQQMYRVDYTGVLDGRRCRGTLQTYDYVDRNVNPDYTFKYPKCISTFSLVLKQIHA